MGKRTRMPSHESNLLLTSGLILLISLILAAMAYFCFTLDIIDPPGASDAPGRTGSSGGGTGVASSDGNTAESSDDTESDTELENIGDLIFPGFVDFSIGDGQDSIQLTNDASNQAVFTFAISDSDGQVLYTATVQPGESDEWTVTDAYDPGTGEYEITVRIDAVSASGDITYNGITTSFTVDMG